MRKHSELVWLAGLCGQTLEKVAGLTRAEADEYGELARLHRYRQASASMSLSAVEADAQSRALHHFARTLERMAHRRTVGNADPNAWPRSPWPATEDGGHGDGEPRARRQRACSNVS